MFGLTKEQNHFENATVELIKQDHFDCLNIRVSKKTFDEGFFFIANVDFIKNDIELSKKIEGNSVIDLFKKLQQFMSTVKEKGF